MGLADDYEEIRARQEELERLARQKAREQEKAKQEEADDNKTIVRFDESKVDWEYTKDLKYMEYIRKRDEELAAKRRQEEKRREEERRRQEEEKRNRKIGYNILLLIVSAVFIIIFMVGLIMEAEGTTVVSIISFLMGWVSVPCLIYHWEEEETKSWVAVVSWILAIVALIIVIVFICCL